VLGFEVGFPSHGRIISQPRLDGVSAAASKIRVGVDNSAATRLEPAPTEPWRPGRKVKARTFHLLGGKAGFAL
jgi:hypothetical protein